jgi:catechol 2,3-dioxygenase
MSAAPVISEVGYVAIRVKDLQASERFAIDICGLFVTDRGDDYVACSHGPQHHSLQYIRSDENAFDHIGLVARDAESLATVRSRIEEAGHPVVSDGPLTNGVEDGFAFEAPGGFVIAVYTRMATVDVPFPGAGVRPSRLGHANFFAADHDALRDLFIDLLDFRVSDLIPIGTFMRCNVDHHGIGVFQGAGVLHHYAWEVPTAIEAGQLADVVDRHGDSVLWGPLRHGMGRNIATYVQEPSGLVVEYYADMQRIYDDDTYVPGEWDMEGHKWYSLWGPQPLPDGFSDLGLPPAKR